MASNDSVENDFFKAKYNEETKSVDIDADPGMVVATGTKPLGEGPSVNQKLYIVQDDGSLNECDFKEARERLLERRKDGHISDYERYRAAQYIKGKMETYNISADDCTAEGVERLLPAVRTKRNTDDGAQAVHSHPEIMHGTPVFAGTRVPVQNLWDYLEGGHGLEGFLEGFPSVREEQARWAMAEAGLMEEEAEPMHMTTSAA